MEIQEAFFWFLLDKSIRFILKFSLIHFKKGKYQILRSLKPCKKPVFNQLPLYHKRKIIEILFIY